MPSACKPLLAASLALVAFATTRPAHAQEESAPAPVVQPARTAQAPLAGTSPLPETNARPSYAEYRRRHPEHETRWYGWQTLIVDGGVLLVGGGLAGGSGEAGGAILVGGYFLGGPIVHWAHGNVGRGFADLGIRVGAPLVLGAGLYYASGGGDRRGGDDIGPAVLGIVGVMLGIGGAIAVDAAVIAREPVNDDDAEEDAKYETRAHHKVASKSPFVRGSLTPVLGPRMDIPGSGAVTGGTIGLSAALY